jgi:hypothetical protein
MVRVLWPRRTKNEEQVMASNAIPIRAIPNPSLLIEPLIQGFLIVMLIVTGVFAIWQMREVVSADVETLPEIVVHAHQGNQVETLPEIVVHAHRR